jgi:ankyrin repeat protein
MVKIWSKQMATIQPPIPVGYVDGSLDPEGLLEEGMIEYLEHVAKARAGSELRKRHKKDRRRKYEKSTSFLSKQSNTEEKASEECEGITCSKTGNFTRLEEILDNGWDASTVDKYGSNGLHWAAGAGHIPILNLLVEHGLSINSANRLSF